MNGKLWIILFFISSCSVLFGQEYNFQYISQTQGLSNTFINGITQDNRGYLFIATGEGVGIYNGQEVRTFRKKDKLVDDYVSSIYKDKQGNIWFGHIQGGSSIYYNGKFGNVHPGAGVDSPINDITEDKDGRVWFVAQDYGLYFYNENAEKDFFPNPSSDRLYYSLHINSVNDFFLGTNKGIEVYNFSHEEDGNHLSKRQNITILEEEQIVSIIKHNNDNPIAISLNGTVYNIVKIDDIYVAKQIPFYNLNESIIVTKINSDHGYLWISTLQNGLLKCKLQDDKILIVEKYNSNSGLKTNSVNNSFVDREGVLWIGTFGEGLASKEDDIFTYYFVDKKINNPITSIRANKTNLFIAQRGKIEHLDKQNVVSLKTYNTKDGLPNDEITSMIFDKDSNLYIGTTLNGVYILKKESQKFIKLAISDDNLTQTIADLEIIDDQLYIATLNGAYKYNIVSGGFNVFNITVGLPHNSIGAIYKTKSNRLFIGTNSAFLSEIVDETIINYPIKDGVEVVEVNDIHEDFEGNIWFSSNGSGVFKLENKKCFNFNNYHGLMSNYCNAIRVNKLGDIWITHNEGLSKIHLADSSVKTYDQYFGLKHRFLRASIDIIENEIWLGTENGAVLYNSDKDIENKVPPITGFQFLYINDSSFVLEEQINLKYGSYKFAFGLAGLTLKGAKSVSYKFLLEGYDEQWSTVTDKNTIYYTRMTEGTYIFRVKSYNADGTEGNEASITIVIEKPYWKKWWFFLGCFLLLAAMFYGVTKFRERSFIKYQEKLKRDLALRTREVVEQKNKIENINKDLTDSINYAQRIQGSILPQDDYIKQLFPKSFVFFRPRDIVSGDFYWCGEIENKQIMICADCTGHGVPGGFMSMISHILIREALSKEALENPALILRQINSKIVEVLKQTDDLESNRDGLDIAIVVIDQTKKEVKYAGAMRPLYIYRNGSRNIIKGDRFSLGGLQQGKIFETKLIEVQTGDKLYIFSDGYADQFGGPRESKMKTSGFQEYLDHISQIDINEQQKIISEHFYSWKGDLDQMDDVLVIGIEI